MEGDKGVSLFLANSGKANSEKRLSYIRYSLFAFRYLLQNILRQPISHLRSFEGFGFIRSNIFRNRICRQ